MNDVYEMFGRKQAELESMHSEYNRLLIVLHSVLNGELESGRVSVDLEKRAWKIEEAEEKEDSQEDE